MDGWMGGWVDGWMGDVVHRDVNIGRHQMYE